jgi:hypothetical protein
MRRTFFSPNVKILSLRILDFPASILTKWSDLKKWESPRYNSHVFSRVPSPNGGLPAMNTKLWRFAAALLPICFLSAQQPAPQAPLQQANRPGFRQPSPEVMRKIAEQRRTMEAHANAINDIADNIHSTDDALQLVGLVAAEFSADLPPRWVTGSVRKRIAHAEYESATNPGALIPEQRIADVWNDFVKRIGAPQETTLAAADVHYLRDAQYVSARIFWVREKDVWTIPGVFAVGPDGSIANGSRALEAIRLLWLLGSNEDDFAGIHAAAQKGVLFSDLIKQQAKSGSGQGQGKVLIARMVSYPVQQAAFRYQRDHGARALNRAIEDLLKNLINS